MLTKFHIYFIPGMAANSKIFENIKLPSDEFEIHYLEWFQPKNEEHLLDYAKRMALQIKHENVVLIGVSFGGVLAQELKQFVNPKKVIIISSVKSSFELSNTLKFAKNTKAYKLLPTQLAQYIDVLESISFGSNILKRKLVLFEKYLSVRDKDYLDWAIENIINWERKIVDIEVIHIHGDKDEVFPIKNIDKCILLKGGTHSMILNKFKWFNENLPKIIKIDN